MAAGRFLRKKRNVWFFRYRLPKRLAACGLSGEVQKTLSTPDKRLAGWLARALALRMEATLSLPQLPSRSELEGRVRAWIDDLHWRNEIRNAATGGYVWFEPDEIEQMGPETAPEMESLLRMCARTYADDQTAEVQAALGPNGDATPFQAVVKSAEQYLNVSADRATLHGRLLERTILRGYATFLQETKTTLSKIEQASAASAPAKPQLPEFAFLQYWDDFRAYKVANKEWKGDTAANAESSRRIFAFLFADVTVAEVVSEPIASEFKTKLFGLPKNYDAPEYQGLSPDKLIAQAFAEKLPTLRKGTINKHTGCFGGKKGYWAYLVNQKKISPDIESPFKGLHVPVKKGRSARHERQAWSKVLEAKFFAGPWIRGCKSIHRRSTPGSEIHRDSMFWVTLWGRLTGVRENEICDAAVGAIKFADPDDCGSIAYLEITEGKKDGSERNVPVPQNLIDMGFLEERVIGRDPDEPLFPELIPQGPGLRRSAAFTGKFTYLRQKTKCYVDKMDFHSFRSNVETQLKNADGIKESWIDEVIGHESPIRRSEGSRYTKEIYLPILKRCIDSITVNADFSHLKYSGQHGVPAQGRDERIVLYVRLAEREMKKKALRRRGRPRPETL
jgi:integrase